jgi:hypothetical protein
MDTAKRLAVSELSGEQTEDALHHELAASAPGLCQLVSQRAPPPSGVHAHG